MKPVWMEGSSLWRAVLRLQVHMADNCIIKIVISIWLHTRSVFTCPASKVKITIFWRNCSPRFLHFVFINIKDHIYNYRLIIFRHRCWNSIIFYNVIILIGFAWIFTYTFPFILIPCKCFLVLINKQNPY